jgi:hypothetical protein
MRITSGGNVGIGTTSPTNFASSYRTLAVNGSSASVLEFKIGDTSSAYLISDGTSSSFTDLGNRFFTIGTNSTERMRITSGGNVGIGTTDPQRRLDVFTTATSATEYQLSLRNGAGANNVSAGIAFGFNSVSLDPDYLSAISSIITNRSTRAADLTFLTAATGTLVERMRISSDGNVGINTDSPSTILDVRASAPTLTLRDSRTSTTWSAGVELGKLDFFTSDTTGVGAHSIASIKAVAGGANTASPDGVIVFSTGFYNEANPSERMRITSDGYLRMALGTSGGIQFNGDTAAANALDDYEEGTFTPTYVGSGGGAIAGYATQIGKYTKIGNVVTIFLNIRASKGTISGDISIGGIPYEVVGYYVNMTTRRRFATDFQLAGSVGASQIDLFKIKSDESEPVPVTDSDMYATALTTYNDINTTFTYLVV